MGDHDALRAALLSRVATLTNRVGRIEQDLRKPGDRDWQERATELENDEVLEGLDALSLAEVQQLRQAVERIDNGTYGLCAGCGGAIGAARLSAIPAATTCVRCASLPAAERTS
ncbi:MAG: TraR/DksA family transcriptional regulator [Acidobacteria bacterium]|nr:TraR/DksA family transcriptional regulator [Acidobacteriota bacterium]